jgi:hypothetical protein
MATTYEKIATQSVSGSSTTNVTFNSISGSYTDLVLIVNAKLAASNNISLRFNSDTASNYSYTYIFGSGTAASSGRASSTTYIYGGSNSTSDYDLHQININNYSNSTTYKTALIQSSVTSIGVSAWVGQWRSTSAITSVDVSFLGNIISAGSTFTIYGILKA